VLLLALIALGVPLAVSLSDRVDAEVKGQARSQADVVAASASELLDPGGRWNNLINAVTTYISGTELGRVSTVDLARYDDTGVNWRVVEGYGTAITTAGGNLDVALDTPVQRIDHSGERLKIETAKGTIMSDRVIVALPSAIIAQTPELFSPALPAKTEAAAGLPLGLADKLFLSLGAGGIRGRQPPRRPHRPRRHRDVSYAPVRAADHRGIFRGHAGA